MTNLGLFSAFLCIAVALANKDYKLQLFHHLDHVMHADSTSVPVLNQHEFLNMFHHIGTNLHDFSSHWSSNHLPCGNAARYFFQEFDANKDNHISDSEINYFFKLFDLNEDQEVTESEFSTAWGALFDGYLATHSIHCSSSDDDDRKWNPRTGITDGDSINRWRGNMIMILIIKSLEKNPLTSFYCMIDTHDQKTIYCVMVYKFICLVFLEWLQKE